MGETSAKKMRGGEMDDVIFSGSASRPSRNVADVMLSLDNTDRTAPAMFNDHEDLEIVRRINRGAGSTYRVNGKEVRARDVQLLFADQATGAHSTALVSQGRVGALINAKATDRRGLLEEAAGITGLHSRRHEAELRLRAAETNLERLDDVIATLEAQHKGLKKQARQATRYRNIADQLRRTEAIALHLEAEEVKATLAEARARLEEAERKEASLARAAAEAATRQATAAAALPPLRQSEGEAAAALQRLLVDRDNLDREEAQAAAALAQAGERRTQLQGDRARAASLTEDAQGARTRLEEERAAINEATAGEGDARRNAEAERRSAAEKIGEGERELAALTEQIATGEARAAALAKRIKELTERVTRLGVEAGNVDQQRQRLVAEREQDDKLKGAEAELTAAEGRLTASREAAEAAGQVVATARTSEDEAKQALQQAESRQAKLEAEAAALKAILEPGEPDIWPSLVDAVTVEPGYEAALGAALGDDLVAPTDEAAPLHWETLVPYDPIPALPDRTRPLSAVVRGPAALDRRLSQIGVVEDPSAGASLQAALRPGQRLVTREGDLWRWDGYTAKADAPTAATVKLAQRNRLGELAGELEIAAGQVAASAEIETSARQKAEAAAAAEREARETLKGVYDAIDQARREQTRLSQQASAEESRLAALEERTTRLSADLAESESELAAFREEATTLPPLQRERAKAAELRGGLAEQRASLAQLQSAVDRLERDAETRAQRLVSIDTEMLSWARRAEESERHIGELDDRLTAVARELEELSIRPAELVERRETLAGLIETAESKRKTAADALAAGETGLAEADRSLKAEESRAAGAREDRIRAEGILAQASQALGTITEKVGERLSCGLDEVLGIAEVDPGQDLPAREEVETKLARLTRERENMGPVNLRAEAEAAELDQQITGMQSERGDLISAISRLRQGIGSLNREGRERLLAAFEIVNNHFSELFVRLFGGGRAHLQLTEADDPLDAGLEIMASPPGKRLQVMSLLSGGEQALTALSLLFAVFLTNPAPICVLDEVDAPLDDANVDRFCSLVDELTRGTSTRFLVITHHRMTMARVDRLFGVTMSERGISQLVSVDLDSAESLRESA
jgi:chromosome segregation protein